MLSNIDVTEFTNITKTFNVLLVDDDPIMRLLLSNFVKDIFQSVFEAKDGQEGFEIFNAQQIDIIITDNLMPKMNGIEMIKAIRKVDAKVPIIVVTSNEDSNYLIEFINIGISQLLKKPLAKIAVLKAIELSIQNIILDTLKTRLYEQEVEILKYQDQQRQLQEDLSLKKQKSLIINDFYLKSLHAGDARWFIDVEFHPLDTMSGDIYSIRYLGNSRIFCCIIDGMGHGISAALTTILSISYLNHTIDMFLGQNKAFELQKLIDSYINYIKKELFDDEIVSATFAILDFMNEEIEYAIFSGYPILLQRHDSTVEQLKSGNLPISIYSSQFDVQKKSISGVVKILFTSDGLVEYRLSEFVKEKKQLEQVFSTTHWLSQLFATYVTDKTRIEDDVIAFYFKKLNFEPKKQFKFEVHGKLNEVINISKTIEELLKNEGIKAETINRYLFSFSELIMNAFEHGVLKLSSAKKRMISEGIYEAYLLAEDRSDNAMIDITLNFCNDDNENVIETVIKDPGNGLDLEKSTVVLMTAASISSLQGRGIYMAKKNTDALFYNDIGNKVTFYFTLD